MQQQPPALSPMVSFPAANLCMAAAPGHLVPAETFATTEDGGKQSSNCCVSSSKAFLC